MNTLIYVAMRQPCTLICIIMSCTCVTPIYRYPIKCHILDRHFDGKLIIAHFMNFNYAQQLYCLQNKPFIVTNCKLTTYKLLFLAFFS